MFFELCTLCINIPQALRNGLHQTVFQNSTGNTILSAYFDIPMGLYMVHIIWTNILRKDGCIKTIRILKISITCQNSEMAHFFRPESLRWLKIRTETQFEILYKIIFHIFFGAFHINFRI